MRRVVVAFWTVACGTSMRWLVILLAIAARAGAQSPAPTQGPAPVWSSDWYVCPQAWYADDGSVTSATSDTQFAGRTDGWLSTLAEAILAPKPFTVTVFAALPEGQDTPVMTGVATTAAGHAALVADGQCERIPGSPLDTPIPPAALGAARSFAAKYHAPSAPKLRQGHQKRNLVAAVLDGLAALRGAARPWPADFAWVKPGAGLQHDVVRAADVPQ